MININGEPTADQLIRILQLNNFKYLTFSDVFHLYMALRCNSKLFESSSEIIQYQLHRKSEKIKVNNILLETTAVLNHKTPFNIPFINVKIADEQINNLNIDDFHFLYQFFRNNIESVKVQESHDLKLLSTNYSFGFNDDVINTLREIKCRRDGRGNVSIIDNMHFNNWNNNTQIFDYFLIDGVLNFIAMDDIVNVLKAFVVIMWLKQDFLKHFLHKHILHANEIFQTIRLKAIEGEMFRFEFHNLTHFRFDNLLFPELIGVFEGTGCYMKHLKLIILNDSLYIDVEEISVIMELIEVECPNLELLEISIYGESDGFNRNGLIKKYSFLRNIDFRVQMFAINKTQETSQELELLLLKNNDVYYEMKLTKEWMITSLTESHVKEILSRPLRTLTLLTHYNQIPNWRFVRNVTSDNNSLSMLQILRIYKKSGEIKQSCIGELFSGLLHLNSQLSLDTLRIEEYSFEEFHVPYREETIKSYKLCLDKCNFGDNADVHNALRFFKKTEILQLRETQISLKMYQFFSFLSQIVFFYCDYLNDDRLVQIYDACPRVKVNIY